MAVNMRQLWNSDVVQGWGGAPAQDAAPAPDPSDLRAAPDGPAAAALLAGGGSGAGGGPAAAAQGAAAAGGGGVPAATATDLFFAKGSFALTADDKKSLDAYAKAYLAANSSQQVVVDGYASKEGDPSFNQKLSDDRAKAVAAYLNQLGVKNVTTNPNGPTDSFAKDDLSQNRRATLKPPLTVRDIVGEVKIEPPLPGKAPNPTLGEKAAEPDISHIPIPDPPSESDESENEGAEKTLKVDLAKPSIELGVKVTFGLRDKKTKKAVLTELEVSAKLSVDGAGHLEPGWELQLSLLKETWEAKLNRLGKLEVEATLSINAEGALSRDILKKVETTVQGEVKAKIGHIAVGAGVKVGPDGKPTPSVFAEWTF
jgi:outer membrane protein OmpA-like peptidoglycan-associated protein